MSEVIEDKPDASALAIRQSIDKVEGALTEFDKISAGLAALELAHPKNLACDTSTSKGMKEALAGRAAWRDPRIAVEKARKAGKAPVLALGKDIDARAAYLSDKLLEGESNYDDQIKAEEARREVERARKEQEERERVHAIQARINNIRELVVSVAGRSSDLVEECIKALVATTIGTSFQEFQSQAEATKADTLAQLRTMHAAALQREAEAERLVAEREELTRLRAADEARRVEQARIDAEARAAEEARLQAERQRHEATMRAQREEQAHQDAEAATARRAADEQAAQVRAEADRVAREEREAEQRRIDAERVQVQTIDRKRAETEKARLAAEAAARQHVLDAADQMLAALLAWRDADELPTKAAREAAILPARVLRDAAVAAALA